MEQPIGPNTTLTIVRAKPGFAKRSGGSGGIQFPSPSAMSSGGALIARSMVGTPSRPLSNITSVTTQIPELASMYLVTISKVENMMRVTLTPGKEDEHTPAMSRAIVSILEQRGIYNKTMKACVVKLQSRVTYDKTVVGGTPFLWTHPISKKKTTFIVKNLHEVQQPVVRNNFEQKKSIGVSSPVILTTTCKPMSVTRTSIATFSSGMAMSKSISKSGIGQQNPQPRPRGRPPTILRNHQLTKDTRTKLSNTAPTLILTSSRGAVSAKPNPVEVIDLDSDEDDSHSESDSDYDDASLFERKQVKSKGRSIAQNHTSTVQNRRSSTPISLNSIAQVAEAQIIKNVNLKQASLKIAEPFSKISKVPLAENISDDLLTSVVSGKMCGLPSKTIMPASKTLSCHYKIPDLKTFKQNFSKAGLEFNLHPFLGDKFLVVNLSNCNALLPKVAASQSKIVKSEALVAKNKRNLEENVTIEPLKRRRNEVSTPIPETKLSSQRSQPALLTVKSSQPPTTRNTTTRLTTLTKVRKQVFDPSEESEDNSTDGSNSSSSSNSGSDSEFSVSDNDNKTVLESGRRSSRRTTVTTNKNQKPTQDKEELWTHDIFKPPPKCFIEAKPCRPIRKSQEGRIYFSLKAKVSQDEYYKNEDLFLNWEKYVRTESQLGSYYKTLMMNTVHSVFVIYHLERQHDKLQLDRSVEMASDGTIKIRLKGEDVTHEFMKYINIDTNTHLNSLLSNLINSNLCPGCPNYALINVSPGALLRDDVWYSKKCSRVVFHDVDKFTTNPGANHNYYTSDLACPACKELKKILEAEKAAIYELSCKFKKMDTSKPGSKRGRPKTQIVYGKYKPPPIEKLQVRKALTDLFLDFWSTLGFKEEEFPKQTSDLAVNVVTEKDFPEIKELENQDPNLIPGLLPVPDSIPILENIDFDENGQTKLIFSEIPLNPYEMNNIHFMNAPMTLPDISDEMINCLMNSSDPEVLVKTLAGIETLASIQTPDKSNVGAQQYSQTGTTGLVTSMNYSDNSNNLATTTVSNRFMTPSVTTTESGISNLIPPTDYHPHYHEHDQIQFSYDEQTDYQHQQHLSQEEVHSQLENITNSDQNLNAHSIPYASGMAPHNVIDFDQNLDFNLTDSSLMFPTFSLTEL